MICLDTNAVIAAINLRDPRVRNRVQQALVDGVTVGIPAIVLYEMWYGIKKSARPRANAAMLATFLSLDVVPWRFEPEDAEEAGDIRAVLERAGMPIGPYDVLIAAQARRRGAVLITANEREFIRVPGLKTEDWAPPA
jgi:tRNA(fMet)-specific endonuclease VapC